MQAEVYIKARKVFVPDKIQNTEKCPRCEGQGQTYLLRYFYLSLEEAIYKCGNPKCLYPFHHFVFKNLIDKTVYYYEEVEDESNENNFMLKISMDGQNKYKSANPMRTELFSESQHNPDIESYDFDLFDLMNDIAPAPSTSKAATTKPNDDFLDFLDEIPNTSANAIDNNPDANRVDSFIDNLLNTTPSTSTIIWPSQQHSPPETVEEVKLTKAVKYIEQVKERKKVKMEKPQETFLQRVCKTKAAQSTNKRKQTATEKVSTFVSAAQNLRPTQFVNQLRSLDLKNSNSGFLRTLAKVKQDSKSVAPSSNVEVKDGPIDTPSISDPSKAAQMKKRRPTREEKNELIVEKKETKPRKKPVKRQEKVAAMATIVKDEPGDNRQTETSVVLEETESISKLMGKVPVNIDLSRISLLKMDKKEMDSTIQMNATPKKTTKRPRKTKTEIERPESKKVKAEKLKEDSTDSLTTINAQTDASIVKFIAAPAEAVSQIKTELPIKTEMQTNLNDQKSDEEDTFTAFSPVTESDLSKHHLMDLNLLKFSTASNIEKNTAKRTYRRRSTISARKSDTKKINNDSDTQCENASSEVSESNPKQTSKRKRATRIRNNNNTDIETIEPKALDVSSSLGLIDLSDHSNELNSSQHVLTIDVDDDTSRSSSDTHVFESIVNVDTINVNNRYQRKKFGITVKTNITVNELMDEWESASEGDTSTKSRTNGSSADSDITIIYSKDLLDEGETISLDSKTETTEE